MSGAREQGTAEQVERQGVVSAVAPTKVVILAGGAGTRLAPYTHVLPKPLLPVGDRAILERVIEQLAEQGFVDITISIGHLAHLVEAVFADGSRFNVEIRYVREDTPLGTAGSLQLVEGLHDCFLVLNGDVLTTLDYRAVVREHRKAGNALTIAVKRRQTAIDFGVLSVQRNGGNSHIVVAYDEKPVIDWTVSMGVYVLEPAVLEFVPEGEYFDFPNLVQSLLDAKEQVGAFLYEGFWLDIGRHEDYEQACVLWEQGELDALTTPGAGSPTGRFGMSS